MSAETPAPNCAAALHALHRAGRILNPWLPGLLVVDQLGRRSRRADIGCWRRAEEDVDQRWHIGLNAEPVLSDPATVGVLLALLREAGKDPTTHVVQWDGRGFAVRALDERFEPYWLLDDLRPSEADAIAAGLVAFAAALPPVAP